MLSASNSLQIQGHKQVDSKGMEKVQYENSNQNIIVVTILLAYKNSDYTVSIKNRVLVKTIIRDKEGHFVKLKGAIHQEYIYHNYKYMCT